MRFEVNVDDGANLEVLHRARAAYNEANAAAPGFVPAADMPSYVQRLMDQAVAAALEPIGITSLAAAPGRITELEAEKAQLSTDLAASQGAVSVTAKA
jgi:hypothetical protein